MRTVIAAVAGRRRGRLSAANPVGPFALGRRLAEAGMVGARYLKSDGHAAPNVRHPGRLCPRTNQPPAPARGYTPNSEAWGERVPHGVPVAARREMRSIACSASPSVFGARPWGNRSWIAHPT